MKYPISVALLLITLGIVVLLSVFDPLPLPGGSMGGILGVLWGVVAAKLIIRMWSRE